MTGIGFLCHCGEGLRRAGSSLSGWPRLDCPACRCAYVLRLPEVLPVLTRLRCKQCRDEPGTGARLPDPSRAG